MPTGPAQHWAKLHSSNPFERPNEQAIVRLVGAILLEQNDERAVQRSRYVRLETIAAIGDAAAVSYATARDTMPRRVQGPNIPWR